MRHDFKLAPETFGPRAHTHKAMPTALALDIEAPAIISQL